MGLQASAERKRQVWPFGCSTLWNPRNTFRRGSTVSARRWARFYTAIQMDVDGQHSGLYFCRSKSGVYASCFAMTIKIYGNALDVEFAGCFALSPCNDIYNSVLAHVSENFVALSEQPRCSKEFGVGTPMLYGKRVLFVSAAI